MNTQTTSNKAIKLIASILLSGSAGAIGSIFTMPNIKSWYIDLDKPPLLPPNEVFGPVWTTLYILTGIALFLVWTAKSYGSKGVAFTWFGIQLTLNALWSFVFFGAHRPGLGIFVIVLLLGSIAATMVSFRRFSRSAVWLLVPYILWVSFATYLTIGVSVLN
jgi:benzodiazapine receptor